MHKIMLQRITIALLTTLVACHGTIERQMDLESPRLLGTSLPRGGEVGTTAPIRLRFSEPVAAETITPVHIVVVPHDAAGTCSIDFACGAGRCHRGRCQRDPISDSWLADLAHPPLAESRQGQVVPATVKLDASGSEAILEFSRPMAPHRLHTLLVSSAITDLAGNALARPEGSPIALSQLFATADGQSGRPTPRLASPPAGAHDVPTNLTRVVVQFSEPVWGITPRTLGLDLASGQAIDTTLIEESSLCQGRQRGTCFELRLQKQLQPLRVIRLRVEEGVEDEQGQAVLPDPDQAFATAEGPDRTPPRAEVLRVMISDGCAVVRGKTTEPADLILAGSWGERGLGSVGEQAHEGFLRLPQNGTYGLRLLLEDIAGNRAPPREVLLDLQPLPRVAITEVLANPAGPEPAQEFIELLNLSTEPVNLAGWTLDDNDDGVGINTLPGGILPPGGYAVVVGKSFNADSADDPPPLKSALLIRVEGTLGASGLSNSGESIVLKDPWGRPVSSYGGQHEVKAKSFNGRSIERLQPGSCDIRSSWRPDPDGRSSPGSPSSQKN